MSNNVLLMMLQCCAIAAIAPAVVSADVFDDLEVHGFATQGFVKTSANSFFGDSERGSFEFTELGINAALEPMSGLRLSGQLLSRKAGEMSDGSPRVDFAVADFSLFSSVNANLNLLAGRIKNALGFYNDTRDVAFTRPGVFLPQTIYLQRVRTLALSADGVGIRVSSYSPVGNAEFQLGIGEPLIDENVEFAYLARSFRGDYEPQGLSWVARLLFETPDERWRFAFSAADADMEFKPKSGDPMTQGSTEILFMVASGQYVTENWTISAEYVSEPIEYVGFAGTPFEGRHSTVEAFYAQLSWRVRNDIELMLRYEEGFVDKADRSGRSFENSTGLPAHSRYLKGAAIGIRWDVTPDFMLRAEFQRNNGTAILSNRENPDLGETKPDWDTFAVSASYRF